MKRIFLPLVALMLTLVACHKENDGLLTLRMEQYAGNAKLHLDPLNYAVWDNGDAIWLNGNEQTVTVISDRATLSASGSETTYTAIYPYLWAGNGTITYPEVQTCRANGIDAPMAAFCGASGHCLEFHNLGAVLAVEVTNATAIDIDVSSIVVTAADGVPINGTYTIDFDDYSLSPSSTGTSTVTLNCATPVTIATGASYTFFIALPPVAAQLTIEVNDNGFNPIVSQSSTHTYARNYGYRAPFPFAPRNNQIWYTNRTTSQLLLRNSLTGVYPLAPVGGHTFKSVSKKGVLTFQSTLDSIPTKSFWAQEQLGNTLASITLPSSVTSIGKQAFQNCYRLTAVKLPDNLDKISGYAFANCTTLVSLNVPVGTSDISDYAFSHCSSLTSISLHSGLTSIGMSAFAGCSALRSLSLPERLNSIGDNAFENCSGLISLSLPEGLTYIGNYAFNYCTGLTTISLPDGLTAIGGHAFSFCTSVSSLYLPASLTSVGSHAFGQCFSLANIYYHRDSPVAETSAEYWGLSPDSQLLYVPIGTADNWTAWWPGRISPCL